jgi:hypothetical protein
MKMSKAGKLAIVALGLGVVNVVVNAIVVKKLHDHHGINEYLLGKSEAQDDVIDSIYHRMVNDTTSIPHHKIDMKSLMKDFPLDAEDDTDDEDDLYEEDDD